MPPTPALEQELKAQARAAKRARAQELLDATMTDGKTPQHVYDLLQILLELEAGDAPPEEVPTWKRRPTPPLGFKP